MVTGMPEAQIMHLRGVFLLHCIIQVDDEEDSRGQVAVETRIHWPFVAPKSTKRTTKNIYQAGKGVALIDRKKEKLEASAQS